MNKHPTKLKRWQLYGPMLVAAAVLSILTACGSTNEPTTIPAATSLSISPTVPSPAINGKEAFDTRVAINDAIRSTSVALTAAPTRTPGRPPPLATATPLMGILPGCGNGKSDQPYYLTCWRGLVGTDYVEVEAGREGTRGDPGQGIVHVVVWHRSRDIYHTRQRVGAVRIASIDQMLFTLVTEDGQHTFLFDLATRQWVTPGPSQVPTYMIYGLAIQATAQAIAPTLPTATPRADIPLYKQPLYQQDDLWQRAYGTAMALNPPSGELQWEAFTPIARQTALPTMRPVAQRAVGNGILYESAFVGPPCTMINPYNYWVGYIGNQAFQVCAGRVRSLPGGAVLVAALSNTEPHSTLSMDIYNTPSQQLGGVSIIDINGEQLTLQTANGARFLFDLATRQWGTPGPSPVPSLPPSPAPNRGPPRAAGFSLTSGAPMCYH